MIFYENWARLVLSHVLQRRLFHLVRYERGEAAAAFIKKAEMQRKINELQSKSAIALELEERKRREDELAFARRKQQLQRWREPRPLMRSSDLVISISYQIYPLKNLVSVLRNTSTANRGYLSLEVTRHAPPPLISCLSRSRKKRVWLGVQGNAPGFDFSRSSREVEPRSITLNPQPNCSILQSSRPHGMSYSVFGSKGANRQQNRKV